MSQYKPVSRNLFVDFAYDISFQEFHCVYKDAHFRKAAMKYLRFDEEIRVFGIAKGNCNKLAWYHNLVPKRTTHLFQYY
jgi:hypothetical protein